MGFRRDCRGATAVEFAVVAVVFLTLLMGIIEYGLMQMTRIAIESATIQVSRSSGLGNVGVAGCADRACEVKKLVEEKTQGLIHADSVFVSAAVVSSPTSANPPKPDICFDPPGNPYPANADDCKAWTEQGGNPNRYDPPLGLGAGNLGSGGDLVEIRVTYLWEVLFPIFRSTFGDDGVVTITATTVVKNEPF
jgi:hypothetical protein